MPIPIPFSDLVFPAMLAVATTAIFSFGKRKPETVMDFPPLDPLPVAPTPTETQESRTLSPLASFTTTDGYRDRSSCEAVWDALEVAPRTGDEEIDTRFFAVTAFAPVNTGRNAAATVAAELARDATERGYSVLLVDADTGHGFLHTLPLFAPRDGATEPTPAGVAEFLRGESSRLEPLLKLAWRTEGLLLLPAGNAVSGDSETNDAGVAMTRLLRLAATLAEIVLVVAPPVFADDAVLPNAHLLPQMDGVLVAYPSAFSAASDTEALEKLESLGVAQVGAIVAPPAAFDNEDTDDGNDLPPTVATVYPVPDQEPEPIPVPEPIAAPVVVAAPEPVMSQSVTPPPVARPSFLAPPVPLAADKPRGDSRRAVPVEAVPIYPTTPAPRPAPVATPATVSYRPDVAIELLPASGDPAFVVLRAEVGGTGNAPKLLLEVRTVAAQSKRLRADNPGSSANHLLVLESLTGSDAPDDVTTLRLVVRESGAETAATLLEAALETPDSLRIKSGKAATAGVPTVRFEVTTERDNTARFRATVPPLGDAPALFVDLERAITGDGHVSRIVLRLTSPV